MRPALCLLAFAAACGPRPATEAPAPTAAPTVVLAPKPATSAGPRETFELPAASATGPASATAGLAPLSAACEALFVAQRGCWDEMMAQLPPDTLPEVRARFDDEAAALRTRLGTTSTEECRQELDALPGDPTCGRAPTSTPSAKPTSTPSAKPSAGPPVKLCWPLDKGCKPIGVPECDKAMMRLKFCKTQGKAPVPDEAAAQILDSLRQASSMAGSAPQVRTALRDACLQMAKAFASCP